MLFSFDEIIDRRGTDSLKYASWKGEPDDLLPLWVADMDFRTLPEVTDALIEKCRHGIFGYSDAIGEDYFKPLYDWFDKRFDWKLNSDWLVKTPGVVFAINNAIRSLTNKGDSVIIQQPVYYPFAGSVKQNDRNLVVSELIYNNGKYTTDIEDFENKIILNKVKLFILCNPHNPVGRVWTAEELTAMGDICLKHGVLVVSDEIHADFVYPGHQHQVFAALKPEFSDITITCTAPTKTFNLAGLQISNIFISNPVLRRKFKHELHKIGYNEPNIMGLVACKAAYKNGEPWLEELKSYLISNLDYVREYLSNKLPKVHLVEPEGTYLIWLDCRELGLADKELEELIISKAGLWLDSGTMFGDGGEGFQRINIACPRVILERAMEQLKGAIDQL